MKEINLVAGEEKKMIELNRIAVKFRKISTLVLIVFIILVSGLMFYFVYLDNKFKTSEKNIKVLKNMINTYDKVESYLIQKQDRIAGIEQIKNTLFSYTEFFNDIENLPIPGIIFNNIEFSKNKVTINASCGNIKEMSDLYEQIFLLAKNNKFSNVLLNNVSSQQSGIYNVNFELVK